MIPAVPLLIFLTAGIASRVLGSGSRRAPARRVPRPGARLPPIVATPTLPLAMSEIARGLGLPLSPGIFGSAPRIEGELDGVALSIRPEDGDLHLRVEPKAPPIDRAIVMRRKSYGGTLGIVTGDAGLDESVFLNGPAELVHAALDVPVRTVARHLAGIGASVQHGAIELVRRGPSVDAQAVVDTARQMVRLARALAVTPAEARLRIARLVASDPEPGVRWRCLRFLVLSDGASEEAREAVSRAASDPDPLVRLVAAAAGRRPGEAIALLLDDTRDDADRAECVSLVLGRLPPEIRHDAIERILARGSKRVRETALLALIREPWLARWTAVAKLLDVPDARTRSIAVQAIAAIGDPAATGAILGRLDDSDRFIVVAAIHALGVIGTTAAVEALRRVSAGRELRAEALAAIDLIKARHGGEQQGQLSVAPPDGGALSLPPGGGELSHASALPLPPGAGRGRGTSR